MAHMKLLIAIELERILSKCWRINKKVPDFSQSLKKIMGGMSERERKKIRSTAITKNIKSTLNSPEKLLNRD